VLLYGRRTKQKLGGIVGVGGILATMALATIMAHRPAYFGPADTAGVAVGGMADVTGTAAAGAAVNFVAAFMVVEEVAARPTARELAAHRQVLRPSRTVPEPASMMMLGRCLAALDLIRRK
jgi:hypothetical protein